MANPTHAKTTYRDSPIGPFKYPWFNRPDVKFNQDGVFKADHVLSGAAAEALATEIEAMAQAALDEHTKDMTPKDRKAWGIHLPFERETDDNDVATGNIVFSYRQNAKIKLKTGEVKEVKIGLYDAAGKEMHAQVYGGSEGRVRYAPRVIVMQSTKKVGIRLDFAMVQISKLAEAGAGGGGGFGSISGGYVEEDSAPDQGGFSAAPDNSSPASGDY